MKNLLQPDVCCTLLAVHQTSIKGTSITSINVLFSFRAHMHWLQRESMLRSACKREQINKSHRRSLLWATCWDGWAPAPSHRWSFNSGLIRMLGLQHSGKKAVKWMSDMLGKQGVITAITTANWPSWGISMLIIRRWEWMSERKMTEWNWEWLKKIRSPDEKSSNCLCEIKDGLLEN